MPSGGAGKRPSVPKPGTGSRPADILALWGNAAHPPPPLSCQTEPFTRSKESFPPAFTARIGRIMLVVVNSRTRTVPGGRLRWTEVTPADDPRRPFLCAHVIPPVGCTAICLPPLVAVPSPKLESRNPKQARMTETRNLKRGPAWHLRSDHLRFPFWICFVRHRRIEFRASDFNTKGRTHFNSIALTSHPAVWPASGCGRSRACASAGLRRRDPEATRRSGPPPGSATAAGGRC